LAAADVTAGADGAADVAAFAFATVFALREARRSSVPRCNEPSQLLSTSERWHAGMKTAAVRVLDP
jgi:hypothetical protein